MWNGEKIIKDKLYFNSEDYFSILNNKRLSSGLVWTIPIVLSIKSKTLCQNGQSAALISNEGEFLGLLEVEEVFLRDKEKEALSIFNTLDQNHPGVDYLFKKGDWLLAGKIKALQQKVSGFPENDQVEERIWIMPKPIFVIMAGGRGERFWPRSRRNCPKQLLSLIGKDSLLQQSVKRIQSLTDDDRIYVVTNMNYVDQVRQQLPMIPKRNILIEPQGRNTAPCVGLAAIYIQSHFPQEDPSIAILPSDALVNNAEEMRKVLRAGLDYTQQFDTGVIYGMWPTRPETGYGYIQLGKKISATDGVAYHQVVAFKEKPDRFTAEKYLESKEYLWNAGIFVWRVSGLLKEIQTNLPELAAGLEKIRPYLNTEMELTKLKEIYHTLPSVSVDYGILEKTRSLTVVPTEFGWDDLGSWSSLERFLPKDENGNVVDGLFTGVATKNCVVYSPKKMVATLGVTDLIIVETDDVLMICAKEKAQEVKKIIEKLREEKREDLL